MYYNAIKYNKLNCTKIMKCSTEILKWVNVQKWYLVQHGMYDNTEMNAMKYRTTECTEQYTRNSNLSWG